MDDPNAFTPTIRVSWPVDCLKYDMALIVDAEHLTPRQRFSKRRATFLREREFFAPFTPVRYASS
ncbi:hypothetical protein HY625_02675 [Candidatus Uhrbacteria bacterium]|nr:hypothetical protein [Candidatus Uhrbacteria bacterium]